MSTLKADTIQNTSGGAATLTNQEAAKSFLRYEQDSSPTVRTSFNISSVHDDGTGLFQPNFTNNMSDAYHVTLGSCNEYNNAGARINFTTSKETVQTTALYRGESYETYSSDSHEDAISNVATFGDLA